MEIFNRFYLKTKKDINQNIFYYVLYDWATDEEISKPFFSLSTAIDELDSIRKVHGEFVYDGVYFYEHQVALLIDSE